MSRCVLIVSALVIVPALFVGCSGGGGGNNGVIAFTAAAFAQNEDGTPTGLHVTLQRVGGSGEVSVSVFPSDGTAVAPDDYADAPILVTWPAGDTTEKEILVSVIDDNIDEQPGETVHLQLGAPTGGASLGAQDTATLTIVDDDDAGIVQFRGRTTPHFEESGVLAPGETDIVLERTGGTEGVVSVTVTSIQPPGIFPFMQVVANSDPASLNEPVDFVPVSFVVTFQDGEQFVTITDEIGAAIVQDPLPEVTEAFVVELSNPTGGLEIGSFFQTLILIDDDDDVLRIFEPDRQQDSRFGWSAMKHSRHVLVGAPGSAGGAGRAYLMDVLSGDAVETLTGGQFVRGFGTAMTRDGDTLAISGNGFVRLYDVDPLTLTLSPRLDIHSSRQGFGQVLLGLGDGRLAVGAPLTQIAGSTEPSGSVGIYDVWTGALLQEIFGTGNAELGASLALHDGALLVGCPGDQQVEAFGGTPLVFSASVFSPAPHNGSRFGASVLPLPWGDVLIGAPGQGVTEESDGQVFILSNGSFSVLELLGGLGDYARFGTSLFYLEFSNLVFVHSQDPPTLTGSIDFYETDPFDDEGFIFPPDSEPGARFGHTMSEYDGVLLTSAPEADLPLLLTDGQPTLRAGVVYIVKPD